jgi:hypothetical protein
LATGLERAALSLSLSLMTTTEDEEEEAWEEGIAPTLPVLASVRAAGVVSFRSSDAVISRRLLSFPVAGDDSAMSPDSRAYYGREYVFSGTLLVVFFKVRLKIVIRGILWLFLKCH